MTPDVARPHQMGSSAALHLVVVVRFFVVASSVPRSQLT